MAWYSVKSQRTYTLFFQNLTVIQLVKKFPTHMKP
jgi:hypothetical protein